MWFQQIHKQSLQDLQKTEASANDLEYSKNEICKKIEYLLSSRLKFLTASSETVAVSLTEVLIILVIKKALQSQSLLVAVIKSYLCK